MSNVTDILGNMNSSDAYYDPSQDFDGVMPAGEYLAHVESLEIKEDIVIKNKFLADIYIPKFTIAKENENNEYGVNGDKVSGKAFVDRKVPSKGFFRFKNPDSAKYPQLSDSPGSNKRYMELASGLGLTVEESDGRYRLPTMDEDTIKGTPVKIKVVHDKWLGRDGDEMVSPKAIDVNEWKEGTKVLSDIPF